MQATAQVYRYRIPDIRVERKSGGAPEGALSQVVQESTAHFTVSAFPGAAKIEAEAKMS
jgi:hypothetical protein